MRRVPIIAVTGGIASGKTTVAKLVAGRRGAYIDCDALGHRVLAYREVRRRLVAAFGGEVLAPSGAISRRRLGRIVFSSDRNMARLNRIVKPSLTRLIAAEVRKRRERARYIVLDAVLLFQYTFSFKVDCVIVTRAPRRTRLARIMRRDRVPKAEALERIERQRAMRTAWQRADIRVSSDRPLSEMRGVAAAIRNRVLARCRGDGRSVACTKN
jgi:dephospho-CoA kinase